MSNPAQSSVRPFLKSSNKPGPIPIQRSSVRPFPKSSNKPGPFPIQRKVQGVLSQNQAIKPLLPGTVVRPRVTHRTPHPAAVPTVRSRSTRALVPLRLRRGSKAPEAIWASLAHWDSAERSATTSMAMARSPISAPPGPHGPHGCQRARAGLPRPRPGAEILGLAICHSGVQGKRPPAAPFGREGTEKPGNANASPGKHGTPLSKLPYARCQGKTKGARESGLHPHINTHTHTKNRFMWCFFSQHLPKKPRSVAPGWVKRKSAAGQWS